VIREYLNRLKEDLENLIEHTKDSSAFFIHYNRINYSTNTLYFTTYNRFFIESNTVPYIPTYIKNGSEWGIFGFLANYLIKTQSLELVLLMGMFGFGLLGASLLSFRRIKINGDFMSVLKTEPLIQNFGYVLARGLGAALVIYLATKGGLAIFSPGATTTDTNGYILLLTCFVGAVYSDKVWSSVRKSLKLTEDQPPSKDPGKP
jgi:hypothetical protein